MVHVTTKPDICCLSRVVRPDDSFRERGSGHWHKDLPTPWQSWRRLIKNIDIWKNAINAPLASRGLGVLIWLTQDLHVASRLTRQMQIIDFTPVDIDSIDSHSRRNCPWECRSSASQISVMQRIFYQRRRRNLKAFIDALDWESR